MPPPRREIAILPVAVLRVMSPMGFSVSLGISESDVTLSPMGFSVSFVLSESDVTHGIFR